MVLHIFAKECLCMHADKREDLHRILTKWKNFWVHTSQKENGGLQLDEALLSKFSTYKMTHLIKNSRPLRTRFSTFFSVKKTLFGLVF
jgi:hypothetical protein